MLQILLQVLLVLATAGLAIVGAALTPRIAYLVRRIDPKERAKGGRPPKLQPTILWVVFWICIIITVVYPFAEGGINTLGKTDMAVPSATTATSKAQLRMTGDLNIAIAQFSELDLQGNVIVSSSGDELAVSVHKFLVSELQDINSTIHGNTAVDIEVWTPLQTSSVTGITREERALSVESLAESINADVIIYGQVKRNMHSTSFIPEFYISERKLRDAEELIGEYKLGTVIEERGDFTENLVTRQLIRSRLLSRVRALAQFIVGLAYYSRDNYSEAFVHFQTTEQKYEWSPIDGKEVLYLFLGNTAGRLNDLASAEKYYTKALSIDPEYARAQVGAAEVIFHHSRGESCELHTVNTVGLHETADKLNRALNARNQPELANISDKVAWLLGRVYFCLKRSGAAIQWSEVELQFQKVISSYHNGNVRLKDRAAESHAYLGLIYLSQDNFDSSIRYQKSLEQYQIAISLSDHSDRKAIFYLWVAHILLQLDACDKVDEALFEAQTASESMIIDSPIQSSYKAFREEVERNKSSRCFPSNHFSNKSLSYLGGY